MRKKVTVITVMGEGGMGAVVHTFEPARSVVELLRGAQMEETGLWLEGQLEAESYLSPLAIANVGTVVEGFAEIPDTAPNNGTAPRILTPSGFAPGPAPVA